MKILAISPYRESTKIALYDNTDPLWEENQPYNSDELEQFSDMISQEEFRVGKIKDLVAARGVSLGDISAFAATGGMLHSVECGTYNITLHMLQDLLEAKYGDAPENLGAVIAVRLAALAGSRYSYVVDPPVVDEMSEAAHITGLPGVKRKASFHALLQRAAVYREAPKTGKPVDECNFISCHLDENVSIGAFRQGKFCEVNDMHNASGAMSMIGCGGIPPGQLVDLCFSGEYTAEELKHKMTSQSGLKGLLETDSFAEIVRNVRTGNRKFMLAFESFMRQLVKEIGACAGVLDGCVDAVVLTGGLICDEFFLEKLSGRIGWIAPVSAYPGNDEILALVEAVMRVMRGEEEAKTYK